MAFAFYANAGIDNIDRIAFADRVAGAIGLTSSAGNAFLCNFHCHGWNLLKDIKQG
jgi:hypothetical protein